MEPAEPAPEAEPEPKAAPAAEPELEPEPEPAETAASLPPPPSPPQTAAEQAAAARRARVAQIQSPGAALDRDDAELHVAELAHQQGLFVRVLSSDPDNADELAAVAKKVSVTLATLSSEHGIQLTAAPGTEPEPEPELEPEPEPTAEAGSSESADRVRRLVASVPIFAALGLTEPEFAQRIALKLRLSDYACGDTVLGLGERSSELFLLASGAVKVRGETEEEQSQGDLTAGAFNLAVLTLAPATPMTATVFATRDGTCMLRLPQADLIEVLRQFKGFEDYMVATDGGQDEGKAKLVRSAGASGWRLAQAAVKQISPLLLKRIKDEQAAQAATLAALGSSITDQALAGGPASPSASPPPPPPPNFWRDNLEHVVAYPLLIGARVKKEIRLGVPQPYRRVVWLRLSGAEEFCRGDYDGYYEAALRLCLKLQQLPVREDGLGCLYPTVEGKYPTFGGELVVYEWLTEEHHEAAKRLLLTLKQFEAKMSYCPMLPAVLCALLQALSEAEVYSVVLALVDRSLQPNTQPKLPHFQLTQQQETIFEMTFYDVATSYASAAVKALKVHLTAYPPVKDGQDDFWDAWKHRCARDRRTDRKKRSLFIRCLSQFLSLWKATIVCQDRLGTSIKDHW
jgi:CRP-like cAMP-binding protein